MRTVFVHPAVKDVVNFCKILSQHLNTFHVTSVVDNLDFSSVEVVVLWLEASEYLHSFTNLKLILNCGSGIDHIIASPYIPRNIPFYRIVDPYLAERVSNYVVEHILQLTSKKKKTSFTVGIMGLGIIGNLTAQKLDALKYNVTGWVRTRKDRSVSEVYIGNDRLEPFLKTADILVCQLPLTDETKGILNKNNFDVLPAGAYLINVGRGGHLRENDLLQALDSGQLSGACLDVIEIEPVTENHPFLKYLNIHLTPHIAGYISAETQAPHAAKMILDFFDGNKIVGKVDFNFNY